MTHSVEEMFYEIDCAITEKLDENPDIKNKISCKKGCAACCHQAVSCSQKEAALLAKQIKEGNVEIDLTLLEKQAENLKVLESIEFWRLPIPERKCVFLSDENTCMAYKYRPLVCRTHFVLSDPKICATPDGKGTITFINFKSLEIPAFNLLTNGDLNKINYLPILLKKELEKLG
jgi:Fe-S-cluster containining protein